MPSALSIEEFDVLFDAVRARLRISVVVGLAATTEQHEPTAIRHAFGTMFECVDALDKLQALLALQRAPREASMTATSPGIAQQPGSGDPTAPPQ